MFSKGKNSRGGAWRSQVPQPTCSWKSESENLTRRGGAKKCVNQWIEIHFVFVFVIVFVFASVFVIVFLLVRSSPLITLINCQKAHKVTLECCEDSKIKSGFINA